MLRPLVVAVLSLLAALVALVWWAEPAPGGRTVGGSITIDGPALFMQGTLLVFGLLGVLLISERFGGEGPDAFTAQGATTPGSPSEIAATRAPGSLGHASGSLPADPLRGPGHAHRSSRAAT